MEHRSLPVAALLIAGLALAAPLRADPQADWDARLARGKELQARGKARTEAAKALLEEEKTACLKKFRVYDCQGDARQRYVAEAREARRLETEGAAIVRQVKKEQLADKDQRRRDEAPAKEAELRDKEGAVQAERGAAEARRGERAAAKERQAEEGARRKADDAERLRKKREKHERKVAEKLEKAQQREQRGAP